MSTFNIEENLVKGEDNSVDVEAVVEKFKVELGKYIARRDTEEQVISGVVHSIFDQHLGKRFVMQDLIGRTCSALNAQPSQYKIFSERISNYVRANTGERGVSLFSMKKGNGGGFGRWQDLEEQKKA